MGGNGEAGLDGNGAGRGAGGWEGSWGLEGERGDLGGVIRPGSCEGARGAGGEG